MKFYIQSKDGPRAKWRNGSAMDRETAMTLAREIDEMGSNVRVVDENGIVAGEMVKGFFKDLSA